MKFIPWRAMRLGERGPLSNSLHLGTKLIRMSIVNSNTCINKG